MKRLFLALLFLVALGARAATFTLETATLADINAAFQSLPKSNSPPRVTPANSAYWVRIRPGNRPRPLRVTTTCDALASAGGALK